MKKKEVIDYFGSQSATAKALGITRQAVNQWPEMVPPAIAEAIERLSNGALKLRHELYQEIHHRPGRYLWRYSLRRGKDR